MPTAFIDRVNQHAAKIRRHVHAPHAPLEHLADALCEAPSAPDRGRGPADRELHPAHVQTDREPGDHFPKAVHVPARRGQKELQALRARLTFEPPGRALGREHRPEIPPELARRPAVLSRRLASVRQELDSMLGDPHAERDGQPVNAPADDTADRRVVHGFAAFLTIANP